MRVDCGAVDGSVSLEAEILPAVAHFDTALLHNSEMARGGFGKT